MFISCLRLPVANILQFFITPVKLIRDGDVDIQLLKAGQTAGYAAQFKSWLEAIMYGKDGAEEHDWSYRIENESEK